MGIFGDVHSLIRNQDDFLRLRSVSNGITKAGLIFLNLPSSVAIGEPGQSSISISVRHFPDLRSGADWLVYKRCSGEVYYYILIANITVNV